MSSIDRYIRSLIGKSDDSDPEARNQVYLAARKAIQKLPPEKSDRAMEELFEAVKNIEAEYVKMEMGEQALPTTPTSPQKPSWKAAVSSIKIPWAILAALLAIILVISFSTYLLFSQFQNSANGEFNAPNSGGSSDKFSNIFKISQFLDLKNMATNAEGTNPPVVYKLGEAENLLKFNGQFALYSKDPLVFDRNSLYLVQLILEVKPATAELILNSGFSTIDKKSGTIIRSAFLHTSKIKPASYRADRDEYFFSKIVTWDDLEDEFGLTGDSAEVRPMVIVSPSKEDTVVIIKSFSVDKLE